LVFWEFVKKGHIMIEPPLINNSVAAFRTHMAGGNHAIHGRRYQNRSAIDQAQCIKKLPQNELTCRCFFPSNTVSLTFPSANHIHPLILTPDSLESLQLMKSRIEAVKHHQKLGLIVHQISSTTGYQSCLGCY
jgi:hypothetical protein